MYGEKNQAAGRATGVIGGAMAQNVGCEVAQPSRVLANDLEDLGRVINDLDDQLDMLAGKLGPVLRSANEAIKPPGNTFAEPPASSQVSAALIEGTRRLRFMLDRIATLRHDIAL